MITSRSQRYRAAGTAGFVVLLLAEAAFGATATSPATEAALSQALARSRTGTVYDRVMPLAHVEGLDGGPASPAIDRATWRQAYDELRRASDPAHAGPGLGSIDAAARASVRSGVLPIAVLDRAFERLEPEASGGWTLVEHRAFAAAVLAPATYRGADLEFAILGRGGFADGAPPQAIAIDFDDGYGFRDVALEQRVRVGYRALGTRTLRIRVTRGDGSVAGAAFTFEVAALAAPLPDDTLHVTATIPYQGQFGAGDAYVYKAPGHAALVNPIVVVEGFDLENDMNWDELYALLNQENLLETLRSDGFDVVVLNFADATDAIQKNGFVVAELIQQVQAAIAPQATLAVVGASMGGLCSRYALCYMESHALPHRVRTWLAFDAPQAGANIPLGIQYWIQFFAPQSAAAADFLAILQRPAARQMLLYHFTDPPGTTGVPDPLRAVMTADFAAVGDYPALTRRVAIANGSGSRQTQGFAPADQVVRWEYTNGLIAVTGNVWALPNQASATIFRGSIRILFSTTSQTVTVSGTQAWDGAPGGSRASMADLDSTAAPYGDIVALHPSHAFIPTISALELATGDPMFDIAGAPDLLALTPFDAVYFPTANQSHVLITPENAVWVTNELEQGVVAVSNERAGAGAIRLTGGVPSPFTGSTRVGFALPRAMRVELRAFDVNGREVRGLLNEERGAGPQDVAWDGRDAGGRRVPAGVYFLRLDAGGVEQTRRIVKLD